MHIYHFQFHLCHQVAFFHVDITFPIYGPSQKIIIQIFYTPWLDRNIRQNIKNEQTCSVIQLSDSVSLWAYLVWQTVRSFSARKELRMVDPQDSLNQYTRHGSQDLLSKRSCHIGKTGQLRATPHPTQDTAGPPFQDLTSGWKQPESNNECAWASCISGTLIVGKQTSKKRRIKDTCQE